MIGLAVSEGELAAPWQSIKVHSFKQAIAVISALAREGSFEKIVIGQPEREMGKIAQKAGGVLQKRGFPVIMADETMSTKDAREQMIKLGMGRKRRRDDNAVAAAIILQRFLEESNQK